ncbi:Fanconi anemia group J protein homolog isoform X1 [Colletes gigas]|uniref:Fanconi anemia group J protein homolog isoform X1 n=1 Tax=Colletes gigas TaxID=935657 RepID=UPI001C9A5634|nr:Fanconi anemia group J protein homolog isoform X1 [Colletes gigas]
MLVIWVITAVIGFVIYSLIKIKIEELLDECRMSGFGSRRSCSPHLESRCSNGSSPNQQGVIELSSDASDSDIDDTISEVSDNSNLYDKFLSKFHQSTDSITSGEDVEELVFPSTSGSDVKTSMFGWNKKNINLKKSTITEDDENDSIKAEITSFPFTGKRSRQKKINFIADDDNDFCDSSNSKSDAFNIKDGKKFNENVLPEVTVQHEQMISGINVKLPVKPYSCQVAVMNKIIQGCLKKENCLLESPTGSGKTLALLCGVLAWHDHHTAEVRKLAESSDLDYWSENSKDYSPEVEHGEKDFNSCNDIHFDKDKLHIPKIFYGTRTHKQIEQVVRELQKTSFKHKKMTVLSSREHTCIQESIRNKTELCNDLLDPSKHKGCPFYNESNRRTISNFRTLGSLGLNPVWNIEELVAIGKDSSACPYFAARSLMEQADIIFCPYNYIIDPDIRESIQLMVKNQVIILDEAHNIEDICRDSASYNFRDDDLIAAGNDCDSLISSRASSAETYKTLKTYILRLIDFLKNLTLGNIDKFNADLSSPYWTGPELLELLDMNHLGGSLCSSFIEAGKQALADYNNAKEDNRLNTSVRPVVSNQTKKIIEHLMVALKMITLEIYTNDYRACVIETKVKDYKYAVDDTWHSVRKHTQRARTLKLLCMNPGVVFSPLSEAARCIILASGTLTPTGSFQSELSTKFAHILNTAHVIPKDQVLATCVPKGPQGHSLRATYGNVNQWKFQDELGQVLIDVCESVPHGILCFFSSYNMMHKQIERWKHNQMWDRIARRKRVFMEPRLGNDLAPIMQDYRQFIEQTSTGPIENIDGALLLAVFRGKVAEGIDFKDDEARCVVTVGIPFAVRTDPVIEMKFKYNNMNASKGLLNGSDWYSIQAFRALNQGLGRCLRHINDWGAVLLVDDRFLMQDYKDKLPKWVKTMWTEQKEYNLKESLRNFVARQKAREESIE